MTSTVFTPGTIIESPWLNDVNNAVYNGALPASDITYQPAGTGAVPTTVQSKLRETVSVLDFGAVGNGATNDTTAIQNCLTASAGKQVIFPSGLTYKVTSALTVGANTTLSLYGATVSATTASFSLFNLGSGCSVLGGNIVGPGNATYSAGSKGISCVGTRNAPAAPTYIIGPKIENVTITEMGEYGIYLQYCDTASVKNCSIDGVGYTGIGMLSCKNCVIDSNYINDVYPGVSSNCYGVFMTQQTTAGSTITSDPSTVNCKVTNNHISNIPTWHGIDTHGGRNIVISGNTIYNCAYGVYLTYAIVPDGTFYSANNCVVSSNVIDTQLNGSGIHVVGAYNGATLYEAAKNNIVIANNIKNSGIDNSALTGGIFINGTELLICSNNVIDSCSRNGVYIYSDNLLFSIIGNSIKDPFSNVSASVACVNQATSNNTGFIEGNNFIRSNASLGTYVATSSIRFVNTTDVDISVGKNSYLGISSSYLLFSTPTATGVDVTNAASEKATATIALVSGQASNNLAIVYDKVKPSVPNVVITTMSGISAGGKSPVYVISSSTVSGFTVTAYPSDLTTWSASGNLNIYWKAAT